MTREEATNMLKAKLECYKRQTSETDFDCDICDKCSLCYEQGNMGQQKEALDMAIKALEQQPEQRYTEEELRTFAHGISLSLLQKQSAQYWQYDKDTAAEIEFLERLYDKVSAGESKV